MKNIYDIKNSKIFITGGAGFIATKIASILANDNEIILYDNLHRNAYKNTSLSQHPNVKLVMGDVLDRDALKEAMDPEVHYVLHCAAIAGVSSVLQDPIHTLKVNMEGTFHLFDILKSLKHLKRVLYISTSEVLGGIANNAKEFPVHPSIQVTEPRWTYAISKLAGELITHSYYLQKNLPTVTLRPFNIFGPNQVGVGAIHSFILQALSDEPLVIHNKGEQIRSWCFIDDFVHGLLLAMSSENAIGKTYHLGSPQNTNTILQLAKQIIYLTQSQSSIEFKKINYEDVEVRIPNIDLARSELLFEPRISLEEGLKQTIHWYEARQTQSQLSAILP